MELLAELKGHVVTLLVFILLFWTVRTMFMRWLDLKRRSKELQSRQVEIQMTELQLANRMKEVDARIAEATATERTGREKARLLRETAEDNQLASVLDELRPARLEAERRRIEAHGQAAEDLAAEFARQEHAAKLSRAGQLTAKELLALWVEYLGHSESFGETGEGIANFAGTISRFAPER